MAVNPYGVPTGVAYGESGVRRFVSPTYQTGFMPVQSSTLPSPVSPILPSPTPATVVTSGVVTSSRQYPRVVTSLTSPPSLPPPSLQSPSSGLAPAQDAAARQSLNEQVQQMNRAVEEQQKIRAERRQQTREDLAEMRKLAEERYKTSTKAMELLTEMKSPASTAREVRTPPAYQVSSPPTAATHKSAFQWPVAAGAVEKETRSAMYQQELPVEPVAIAAPQDESMQAEGAMLMAAGALKEERTSANSVAQLESSQPPVPPAPPTPPAPQASALVTEMASGQDDVKNVTYGQTSIRNETSIDVGRATLDMHSISTVADAEVAGALAAKDVSDASVRSRSFPSATQANYRELDEPAAPVVGAAAAYLVADEPASYDQAVTDSAVASYEVVDAPAMVAPAVDYGGAAATEATTSAAASASATAFANTDMLSGGGGANADQQAMRGELLGSPGPARSREELARPVDTQDIGGWTKAVSLESQQQRPSASEIGQPRGATAAPEAEALDPVGSTSTPGEMDRGQSTKQRLASREQLYADAAPAASSQTSKPLEVPLLDKGEGSGEAGGGSGEEEQAPENQDNSCRHATFQFLEGYTSVGKYYLLLSTILVLVNYAAFTYHEEFWKPEKTGGPPPPVSVLNIPSNLLDNIETSSVILFTVDYLLRLWTCVYFFKDFGPSTSCTKEIGMQLQWACFSYYSLMDILSIAPFYIDLMTPDDTFRNTAWIRVGRVLKLLPPLDYKMIWEKSWRLLTAGGFVGFVLWVICASLYYMFERDNPDMEGRFQSIPLAMYFSLLNFFGEYPLADTHSLGGRYIAVFIQIFGAAALAIPAGALGNAFSDVVTEAAEDKGEDADDAEGNEETDEAADAGNQDALSDAIDGKAGIYVMQLPLACGELDFGVWFPNAIYTLSIVSVINFIVANMSLDLDGKADQTLEIFSMLDMLATLMLAVDFFLRVYCSTSEGFKGCCGYVVSVSGFVDLTCWLLPVLAYSYKDPTCEERAWLSSFTVLRILKLERAIGAFDTFRGILWKTRKVFLLTGAVAMVLWLQFSAIMYYCERNNPDDDMNMYYQSISASMWVTLLNLSGEAPLCDYTTAGKWVTGLMGFFGQGVVTIPMGLLGAAFEDELDGDDDDDGKEDEKEDGDDEPDNEVAGELDVTLIQDSELLTPRQRVFKFLQGSAANQTEDLDPWEGRAVRFEKLVFLLIFLSAFETIFETMPSCDGFMRDYADPLNFFQALVVLVFTVEYALRYYTAPEDAYWKAAGYTGDAACRWAFLTSFSSIIDLLAIGPFYLIYLGSTVADEYDGQLRMLRVFRLLTLDKYIPSISLVSRIVRKSADQFKQAGYAALCLLVIFATLLWLTERHNEFKVDALRESFRYRSVMSGSPYTLVHLTGDYPLIDYTPAARIVMFFALVGAVGVVAVPTGLLASGFQSELKAVREENRKARDKATTVIQKAIKGFFIRKRFNKVIADKLRMQKGLKAEQEKASLENNFQKRVSVFLAGKTRAGQAWGLLMPILAILNTVSVIVESEPRVHEVIGQNALDLFELFSVLIFTAGYLLQVYAAPMSSKYGFHRWNYVSSFWGVVDLITVLPWWIQQIFEVLFPIIGIKGGEAIGDAFIFRVFRLLRLLQLEDFLSAFTLLDDAWRNCRDTMVATGFLALLVWVCGGVLFYNFEKGNPNFDGDPFGTLPMSMYYTGIFLGGEWALIDFTPCGQIVCIFYCVIGIGLHGIPVGAVFEAFSDVIESTTDILDDEADERNN